MITKTKFWKVIQQSLKETEKADQMTTKIMKLIKDISQNEDKD